MGLVQRGPTKESALLFLLRNGESSAAVLAQALGVSVQAMRRHLRNLEQSGLVQSSCIAMGSGRPSNIWQLTSAGKNTFDNGGENFANELLGFIGLAFPKEEVLKLLYDQALEKAKRYKKEIGSGPISFRLKRLVALRRLEGYLGEFEVSERGGFYMREFHCAIEGIAAKFPIVCDQELQMIRHILSDCKVDRVHWTIEGGHHCGFHIVPDKKNG